MDIMQYYLSPSPPSPLDILPDWKGTIRGRQAPPSLCVCVYLCVNETHESHQQTVAKTKMAGFLRQLSDVTQRQ